MTGLLADAPAEIASLRWPLGVAMVTFVVLTYALGFLAQARIEDEEDFLVAGRRLPLGLAWATLMATWFGAGAMLTAADAVHESGLRRMALEPLGAGISLLLAGIFIARPLWEMKLLTLSDFYGRAFGVHAEKLSAALAVPTYLGWIAVQFVALAGILDAIFGIPPAVGLILVAAIGGGYTLLGGMWSVTLTDALQLSVLLIGLVILGVATLASLGSGEVATGLYRIGAELPPEHLILVPTHSIAAVFDWVTVLAISALGNLPSQDLTQRIFAAKSSLVARRACLLAGTLYIVFGGIPVILGLAAKIALPDEASRDVLPQMAGLLLDWRIAVVFVVALAAAVLSTIDSALLAPSSVLAHNLLAPMLRGRASELLVTRLSIVGVALCALVVAFLGESAYAMLEESYAITFCALFVPLAFGLYRTTRNPMSAVWSMGAGGGLWLIHFALGWQGFLQPLLGTELTRDLPIVGIAALVHLLADHPLSEAPSRSDDALGAGTEARRH